jgi:hypothetical protein
MAIIGLVADAKKPAAVDGPPRAGSRRSGYTATDLLLDLKDAVGVAAILVSRLRQILLEEIATVLDHERTVPVRTNAGAERLVCDVAVGRQRRTSRPEHDPERQEPSDDQSPHPDHLLI